MVTSPKAWALLLTAAFGALPAPASPQGPTSRGGAPGGGAPPSSPEATANAVSDTTEAAVSSNAAASGLPVFFTAGLAFGRRSDGCTLCASPRNKESFSAHLSLGKYLGHGLGVGIAASAWRRGHPGPVLEADSAGAPGATSLDNLLGNASVSFSWQVWRLWVRAGGGLAWAHQDVVEQDAEGNAVVARASGVGIGYSVGGGFALPLAGPASLAFYANYNGGRYDLATPTAVLERKARHEYLELGVGITLR